MIEIFLIIITLIWLLVASIQDIKKHEVQNFISFSLIAISLFSILIYSILNSTPLIFKSLLYLLIFFILAELLYYSRIFAGGDAKIIMSLGPIFSLFPIAIPIIFISLMILIGALDGITLSIFLLIKNKNQILKKFKPIIKTKYLIFPAIILIIIPIILKQYFLLIASFLLISSPFLFSLTKAIEETVMIKKIPPAKLVEGDILEKPIKIKNKTIKPDWEGLNENQIKYIQKNYKKKINIKEGFAFAPSITIAFILTLILPRLNFFKIILESFL